MRNYPRSGRAAAALVVVGAVVVCAACSTADNPFSGSSVSEVDRVFLAAAGNWDRNKDGTVSCDEWKAYAAELFDAADANRDGMIDESEYAAIIRTDRMFETADFRYFDANRDGKLTRAEFIDRPNPAFVLLDKAKTCQLTATELTGGRTFMQAAKPTIAPPTGPQDEKGVRGGR